MNITFPTWTFLHQPTTKQPLTHAHKTQLSIIHTENMLQNVYRTPREHVQTGYAVSAQSHN